jgi:hypothetical protein
LRPFSGLFQGIKDDIETIVLSIAEREVVASVSSSFLFLGLA